MKYPLTIPPSCQKSVNTPQSSSQRGSFQFAGDWRSKRNEKNERTRAPADPCAASPPGLSQLVPDQVQALGRVLSGTWSRARRLGGGDGMGSVWRTVRGGPSFSFQRIDWPDDSRSKCFGEEMFERTGQLNGQ